MNLVGKVGEANETHKFLANNWRRGGVVGRDERGIGGVSVAILGVDVAVAAGIVGHLSEGAWAKRWNDEEREETERLNASPVVVQLRGGRRLCCLPLFVFSG